MEIFHLQSTMRDEIRIMDVSCRYHINIRPHSFISLYSYDGFQLDLQLQDETGGDISSFVTNGEWDLLGMEHHFNIIIACE